MNEHFSFLEYQLLLNVHDKEAGIEKLRAALKFYADCNHYDEHENRVGIGKYRVLDFGTVARNALGE
jgi:hypothetical protein